jgi:hypothetical protein
MPIVDMLSILGGIGPRERISLIFLYLLDNLEKTPNKPSLVFLETNQT